MAPMLASLDRRSLGRSAGGRGVSDGDMEAFGEFVLQVTAGDTETALATWERLPVALQETIGATQLRIVALQNSEDEAAYADALRRAAERFPPPQFRFALVDVHFLEKRYDLAVRCIDEFMAAVDRDAALLTLRALVLSTSGDTPAAHASLLEALALEPDCEYAHQKGLDVLLAAKDHARTRASIEFLESLDTYTFQGQLVGPIWADFAAAPESEPWR